MNDKLDNISADELQERLNDYNNRDNDNPLTDDVSEALP